MARQKSEFIFSAVSQNDELVHLYWDTTKRCVVAITRNENGQAVASRHTWDQEADGDPARSNAAQAHKRHWVRINIDHSPQRYRRLLRLCRQTVLHTQGYRERELPQHGALPALAVYGAAQ